LDEIEMNLSIYSRFAYRTEKRQERWRISAFDAIYMHDELAPAVPGCSISIDPRELESFRSSYRLLSYVLSRHGYTIAADLPGEDQPETVRALMAEIYSWAAVDGAPSTVTSGSGLKAATSA
jgi:hypothetical protein